MPYTITPDFIWIIIKNLYVPEGTNYVDEHIIHKANRLKRAWEMGMYVTAWKGVNNDYRKGQRVSGTN